MSEFIQYGPEWEKEVGKNSKPVIVGLLKKAAQDRDEWKLTADVSALVIAEETRDMERGAA